MTRSRLFLLSSVGVVAVGVLGGLAARGLDSARPGLGPMPAAALALPSDATFAMGLDVTRLVSSPIYERMVKSGSFKAGGLGDLEKATGLLPGRDITALVVAGTSGSDTASLVFGRFDLARLATALDAEGTTTKALKTMVRGIPVYSGINATGKGGMALALVDSGTLAIGSSTRVEALLAARAEKKEPFLASGKIAEAVRSLTPGSTLWLVGDGNLTKNMSGGGMSMPLPQLETLVMTGDFAPELSLRLTGHAMDATAAKQIADMARGFIAMATMQSAQKPELQALASGLAVTSEGPTVSLKARIPYDVLDKLMPQPKAPAAATR